MPSPTAAPGIHPTQKPVDLYKWILDNYAKPGDKILCRLDEAGRHFGMRIKEDIQEK